MPTLQHTERGNRWLRYGARAIALIWAGWWMLFSVLAGIGEGGGFVGIMLHPGWLFLLTALIAWRWQTIGAALLLFEGLGTQVLFPFSRVPEGFLILTLPPLVAGSLFLVTRLTARTAGTQRNGA